MKKAVSLLLFAVLVVMAVPVFAGGDSPEAVFISLDVDKDGRLVQKELCAYYTDAVVCRKKFILFDQNGDGYIVQKEFIAVFE